MKILTDSQKDRLAQVAKTQGKTLQGCHTYDVLANPLYLDDFQYVSAAEEDRIDLIIDDDENDENDAMQSDLVRLALNLAYMSERQALNFKFDKNAASAMLKANLSGLIKARIQ